MARKDWTVEELALLPDKRRWALLEQHLGMAERLACSFALGSDAGYQHLINELTRRQHAWNAAHPRPTPRPPTPKASISRKLAKRVMERDAYRCQACGVWEDLCVDHIIPESKGGTLDLANLQTLCRTCNSRKGARV